MSRSHSRRWHARALAALCLALLPLAAPASAAAAGVAASTPADTPAEGIDYVLIAGGQPFDPRTRGIEVAEVFAYWCPHCAQFRAPLAAWEKTLPKGTHLTLVPSVGRDGDVFPAAFFAAQSLGADARTHEAVFAAIHDNYTLPSNASEDELAGFYAGLGFDPAKFRAALQSPAVAEQLARARGFEDRAGIEGVPTLIVAGKYRVLAPDYAGMFATARWLLDRELRQRAEAR